MKKILKSLLVIGAVGIVVIVGTTAFLSDNETSAGNTFVAGAVDLKIDNESYYNGEISSETTFGPSDLDNGLLFINFTDVKPDDEGEDTISIHVNNNDAWLCMDMALTSNDDRSSNNPELKTGDPLEDPNNTWDGELAGLVQMAWWADDGDNVFEIGEKYINGGIKTVKDFFGDDKTFSADLADSTTNIWTNEPGSASGDQTYYIGKAWCFGTLTSVPVQPGDYDSPIGPQGSGFVCDGKNLGNESQTDGLTLDIAFRAMQARHNPRFTCGEEQRLATITVTKQIVNDNGGNNVVSDYQLFVFDGTNTIPVTSGVPTVVPVGDYIVTETGVQGYVASFAGPDCDSVGQLTLLEGDSKSCTVVNNDLPPNITLVKSVTGTPPLLSPTVFGLKVDGNLVLNNTSVAVTANAPHTISENGFLGYEFISITGTSNYGKSCPALLGGSITLDEGEAIVCTITNNKIPLP